MKRKRCTKCRKYKPLNCYASQKRTRDGLRVYCRSCSSAITMAWQKNNPERHKALRRAYQLRKAGVVVSADTVMAMQAAQRNRCAICGRHETSAVRGIPCSLSLDHCHKTNEVRGLLCRRCNQGLGNFGDDIGRLRAAIAYLEAVR